MAVKQDNRMVASNSSIWAKVVAFLKVAVEYTNDYLGGQKYNLSKIRKQGKQK